MKRSLITTLIAVLLMPLLVALPAGAIAREDGTSPASTGDGPQLMMTTQAQTDDDGQAEPASTLEERLEARKSAREVELTTAQQQRLRTRCAAAQTKLTAVRQRVETAAANRANLYALVGEKLTAVVNRLTDAGVDTADLSEQRVEYDALVAEFTTDMTTYQQALADLSEMTCADDPAGFQASLEEAREARSELASDTQSIRRHLSEVIKATLTALRADLGASQTGGDQ